MSESLLDVFNEMHRLKNENEMLKRELSEQAVRVDELLVELGEMRLPRGAYTFDSLRKTHAIVDVDLPIEEAIILPFERRARRHADLLAQQLLRTPGLARIVDLPDRSVRTTFYLLRIPGSKATL